jgi:hypothetical protein
MKMTGKFLLVGAVAVSGLICSANEAGVVEAGGAGPTLQSRLDDLTLRLVNSVAQWQPASGYVPVDYPKDRSWERMVAMTGH